MPIQRTSVRARVVITPRRPALDTELQIRLYDLPPLTPVTVRASQIDPRGGTWCSFAVFISGPGGTVDLHQDGPIRGTYTGTDPMGLIWSMELLAGRESDLPPAAAVPAGFLAPLPLTIVAEIDGQQVGSARVDRLRAPDGLTRAEVREHGLVGTLYRPDRGGVLPGVLLLGGAEGGMHEDDAALLAAHGYAVLALAYYGAPGLPATLQGVPLEYFGHALQYLLTQPYVDGERLAVIGASKGGEAALLIGVTFPRVRIVVSAAGSGLVTQGISQDVLTGSFLDIIATPAANWTYRGRSLAYLPNDVTPELAAQVASGSPVALRWAIQPPRAQPADVAAAATIAVERINGPVLLISGGDDQGYGAPFHQVAAERLAARGHGYPWKHVVYPGAGHLIAAPPYGPTTRSTSPGPGITFNHGGNPAADARARVDGRRRILQFLAAGARTAVPEPPASA